MYATEVWIAHPPFCQGPIGSKATNAPCRTSTQRRRRVGGAPLRVRLRLGLMRVSREHSHRAWPVACCATRAHMWDRRLWSFPGPQSQLTNTQALVNSSLIALARLGELFRRRRGSWQLHPCTLDCGCPSGNVCVSPPFREVQKRYNPTWSPTFNPLAIPLEISLQMAQGAPACGQNVALAAVAWKGLEIA